jgi:hypothetical protein
VGQSLTLREWERLRYEDPERILVGLRRLAADHHLGDLPYKVASLRSRELREYGENRQCALFCQGLRQAKGIKMEYAQLERADYDFVGRFEKDGFLNYFPIQMKEVVPEGLNSESSLQVELDKLTKYADSTELVIAVHINRVTTVHLSKLVIPTANIGALWLFGANDLSQSTWTIIGDLMRPGAAGYEFAYPQA